MEMLSPDYIRKQVAETDIIYRRGERLFEYGACMGRLLDTGNGMFEYAVDGNYGDYTIKIRLSGDRVETSCDCPYPGPGCKHTVAALLDISHNVGTRGRPGAQTADGEEAEPPYLSREEIRAQAIEDREKRARTENLHIIPGDMFKGEHLVETPAGKQYTVTLHDPANGIGHCSCPDFTTNRLKTCKHFIAVLRHLQRQKGYEKAAAREIFPFVDIFWDSEAQRPRIFCEHPETEPEGIREVIEEYFDGDGLFKNSDLGAFTPLLSLPEQFKRIIYGLKKNIHKLSTR